jgi:hypothetical protein
LLGDKNATYLCSKIISTLRCPSGWFNGSACYYFGLEAGDVSFFEAEEFCQSLHEETGLAEIHHESDQNLITAALKEHNLNQYDWWAGATDEYQVGCGVYNSG